MTRKEALQELLVKVKGGECCNDGTMYEVFGDKWLLCFDAYHGSMDEALSLFEAVLPGWVYGLNIDANNEKYAFVSFGTYETDECYSDVHARALLIATLEALVEMEEG